MSTRIKLRRKYVYLLALLILMLIVVVSYSIMRILFFIEADYDKWADWIVSCFLLIAELFILLHSIAYFANIIHIAKVQTERLQKEEEYRFINLDDCPSVAVVVASYKEPLYVIQNTLICFYNLNYPNKHLYFLDDTRYDTDWDKPAIKQAYREAINQMCQFLNINVFRRKWHHAKAGIINDFLKYSSGQPLEGSELIFNEKEPKKDKEKYLIVFDVDMNPLPNLVFDLVKEIEKDPKLAFVQTPQYYSNFEVNRVARASSLMHAVFYEYICEAKGMEHAMFCCGTNFIMRIEALEQVGGFDQISVTEDFATSFALHKMGWHSAYLNQVCAFGMGPEDLGAYFKQQYRWAFGTLGMLRIFIKEFFRNPRALPFISWWQYMISGSYYLVGIAFFIMLICPIIYLFFDVPSYFANPYVYSMLFGPYIFLTNLLFYWTLRDRHYRFRDLFIGVILIGVTFPVFMKAAFSAFSGRHAKFVITPKGQSNSLPLIELWPQLFFAMLSFSAIVWAILRMYYEREPFYAFLINAVWTFYYFLILCFIFYFNDPVEGEQELELEPV